MTQSSPELTEFGITGSVLGLGVKGERALVKVSFREGDEGLNQFGISREFAPPEAVYGMWGAPDENAMVTLAHRRRPPQPSRGYKTEEEYRGLLDEWRAEAEEFDKVYPAGRPLGGVAIIGLNRSAQPLANMSITTVNIPERGGEGSASIGGDEHQRLDVGSLSVSTGKLALSHLHAGQLLIDKAEGVQIGPGVTADYVSLNGIPLYHAALDGSGNPVPVDVGSLFTR